MLNDDAPTFANWDQHSTAVEADYAGRDPAEASTAVEALAEGLRALLAGVAAGGWRRPGRGSDGASFTVDSVARYALHDVVHYLADVGRPLVTMP